MEIEKKRTFTAKRIVERGVSGSMPFEGILPLFLV
jgi:hypothetical protein